MQCMRSAPGKEPVLLRDSVPGARKKSPQSSALALVQTGLQPPSSSLQVGDTPLPALAAPAGVGQGQGVTVYSHGLTTQTSGALP
jgi:hypothetical protein